MKSAFSIDQGHLNSERKNLKIFDDKGNAPRRVISASKLTTSKICLITRTWQPDENKYHKTMVSRLFLWNNVLTHSLLSCYSFSYEGVNERKGNTQVLT